MSIKELRKPTYLHQIKITLKENYALLNSDENLAYLKNNINRLNWEGIYYTKQEFHIFKTLHIPPLWLLQLKLLLRFTALYFGHDVKRKWLKLPWQQKKVLV